MLSIILKLSKEHPMLIMIDNIHISEENKMASYTALWNEMIDIEEIEYVIVDGVEYKVDV